MKKSGRRTFLKSTGALALPMLLSRYGFGQAPDLRNDHFFLFVFLSGGLDSTYAFDAKSLELTDRGHQQNYLYKNSDAKFRASKPVVPYASNGNQGLRSSLTETLMRHFDKFSVVNGIHMKVGSNDHGSNVAHMLRHDSNRSFIAEIGAMGKRPLDQIHFGGYGGDGIDLDEFKNLGNSIKVPFGEGVSGLNALAMPTYTGSAPLERYLHSRFQNLANLGKGALSSSAQQFENALQRVPQLRQVLSENKSSTTASKSPFRGTIRSAMQYFKGGLTSACAMEYDFDPELDVHSYESAQVQSEKFALIYEELAWMFDTLAKTDFDAARGLSFLDVTTVVVTTEFSRTRIKEVGADPRKSGTDHNELTNFAILGGKGIRPGRILGQSDCDRIDGKGKLILSDAHQSVDTSSGFLRPMGKVFDFENWRAINALPTAYRAEDYLTWANIANTLMEIFSVPSESHFRINGTPAKRLGVLLG